jgi:hypothetical protein
MRSFRSEVSTSKTGICANCHVVRSLRVNIERQQIQGIDGTITSMEISTAHCETCGSFVSRESREVTREDSREER